MRFKRSNLNNILKQTDYLFKNLMLGLWMWYIMFLKTGIKLHNPYPKRLRNLIKPTISVVYLILLNVHMA